jgi:hypothetical protein
VAVGAQPRNTACAAGLIYINITDISKPYSPGCSGLDGYVHGKLTCLFFPVTNIN